MRFLLLIALLFPILEASADPLPFVTISDSVGDDHGAGTLLYPQRDDFQAGDLDLLQLQISRDAQGFWFEATFKNPIRDPGSVISTVGGDSLASFARKGFYQFNVDVYVDTDRIEDSGSTLTLPGRHVTIDRNYAWEKAVILTPRPELMRQQLISVLAEQHPEIKLAEIETSVDQSLFFPTRIKVRNKTIAYFVPASFFGGSDSTGWAATALVTGAITTVPADFSLFPSTKKPLDILQLGVMQPALGHPKDTFGYSGGPLPSPVVDVLNPSVELQVEQLSAKGYLTGVSWGAREAVGRSPMPAPESSMIPIATLLQSETAAAGRAVEPGAAEVRSTSDVPIAKRLQALQQLLDQKLIDETEYRQQKQRILNEL